MDKGKQRASALILVIILGIIFILVSRVPVKKGEAGQAEAWFETLKYQDTKEFMVDCNISEDVCLVAGDSSKGWVVGAVNKTDLNELARVLQESNITGKNIVINETNDALENVSAVILDKAAEFSDHLEKMFLETEIAKKYKENNQIATTFVQPAIVGGKYLWRVGFGSPLEPKANVYILFDGSSVY